MPLYEYECESCTQRFERIQKFSDPPVTDCPSCGGPVRKLLSSPAIQFKGAGWYITDYARKGGEAKPAGDKSGETTAEKSADKTSSSDKAGEGGKTESSAPKSDKPAAAS